MNADLLIALPVATVVVLAYRRRASDAAALARALATTGIAFAAARLLA